MRKLTILTVISLLGLTAVAAPGGAFTKQCQTKLEKEYANKEKSYLDNINESYSDFEAIFSYNKNADEKFYRVSVRLEDKEDGRYVAYRGNVGIKEAKACKVELYRDPKSACRYSAEGSLEDLLERMNAKAAPSREIKADSELTPLEEAQIRKFLSASDADPSTPIGDIIRDTDDEAVDRTDLRLANGRRLSYYGAYMGDNPIGIFYDEGSLLVRGSNSDGSFCINYETE